MAAVTTVELKRDCPAIQIPVGNPVTLKAGTPVDITQTLGGTFTVHSMGGLFRIDGRDAGALGVEPPPPDELEEIKAGHAGKPPTDDEVWEVLKTCYDPEIPVNIVDLGLVYDLNVRSDEAGRHKVFVKMTLTAPGCGMGPVIARDAQQKILSLEGVADASVEVVWDPPWHQSMITPAGRKVLGLE